MARVLLTVFVVFLGAIGSAEAASFDCSKAVDKLDKVICQTSTLSKLDEDMAQLYRQAQSALSPEGQKHLKDEQRFWVGDTRRECRGGDHMSDCLSRAYIKRIADLKAIWAAPVKVVRKTRRAVWTTEIQGEVGETIKVSFRSPFVDAPGDARAADLNRLIDELGNEYINRDFYAFDTNFVLDVGSDGLLSFTFTDGIRPAAVPWTALHYLWREGREFTASDLFEAGSGWENFLIAQCREPIVSRARRATSITEEVITNLRSWEIRRDGMKIYPDVIYSGAGILMTWDVLRPYMKADVQMFETLSSERVWE